MPVTPDPEKRGGLQFFFAKSLPYAARMALVAALIGFGLLLQLFISVWPGWVLMSLGMLLAAHRGISASPTVKKDETWAKVTPDEFAKVVRRDEQWRAWDRDSFDVSNALGCFMLFVFAGLLLLVSGFLAVAGAESYMWIFIVNSVLLLAPLWFIGVRTFMTRDELILKLRLLRRIIDDLRPITRVQVMPMLATRAAEEGGRVPSDARMMIRIVDAPEWFMGIQAQICLNNVQGTNYPYLYAVVLTKPEAMKLDEAERIALSAGARKANLTIEKKRNDEADVLVIRQTTSRTSGYHTKDKVAIALVKFAVNVAAQLTKK